MSQKTTVKVMCLDVDDDSAEAVTFETDDGDPGVVKLNVDMGDKGTHDAYMSWGDIARVHATLSAALREHGDDPNFD